MTIDQTHSGPQEAICAVCGLRIAANESRYYGPTGAVHIWDPEYLDKPRPAFCRSEANRHLYPNFYTDG